MIKVNYRGIGREIKNKGTYILAKQVIHGNQLFQFRYYVPTSIYNALHHDYVCSNSNKWKYKLTKKRIIKQKTSDDLLNYVLQI